MWSSTVSRYLLCWHLIWEPSPVPAALLHNQLPANDLMEFHAPGLGCLGSEPAGRRALFVSPLLCSSAFLIDKSTFLTHTHTALIQLTVQQPLHSATSDTANVQFSKLGLQEVNPKVAEWTGQSSAVYSNRSSGDGRGGAGSTAHSTAGRPQTGKGLTWCRSTCTQQGVSTWKRRKR